MDLIYGLNSVKEFLKFNKTLCERIIFSSNKNEHAVKEIIHLATIHNIPVEFYPHKHLDRLTGCRNHQGIVCICKDFVYADLDKLIPNEPRQSAFHLILILDSIMDPHNLGSIIRSAFCLGANGVVIPSDRAARVSATVGKTSAGSVWKMPIAKVTNISQAIDYFKERGFWIFGAEVTGGQNVREIDFQCHAVLVFGGEAKGLRPLIRKRCDYLINIPMVGDFNSLNVSVAAGIVLYEVMCKKEVFKSTNN